MTTRWTLMGAPLGRVVVTDGPSIGPDDGIGVEVEVVPSAEAERLREALQAIAHNDGGWCGNKAREALNAR